MLLITNHFSATTKYIWNIASFLSVSCAVLGLIYFRQTLNRQTTLLIRLLRYYVITETLNFTMPRSEPVHINLHFAWCTGVRIQQIRFSFSSISISGRSYKLIILLSNHNLPIP